MSFLPVYFSFANTTWIIEVHLFENIISILKIKCYLKSPSTSQLDRSLYLELILLHELHVCCKLQPNVDCIYLKIQVKVEAFADITHYF